MLPCNIRALTVCRYGQIQAIREAIKSNTCKPHNIENGEISHYLLKYAAKEVGEPIERKLPTFDFEDVTYE